MRAAAQNHLIDHELAIVFADRPGIGADALATDLRARDASDFARMQPAEDAQQIDTTDLRVDDVVERIEEMVRARSAV